MKEDATLFILGYKKQHFKENQVFYYIFQEFLDQMIPYFECEVDDVENYYIKSHDLFKQNFSYFDIKFFEEKKEITLDYLLGFLKSWSAYLNFLAKHNEDISKGSVKDPLYVLKNKILQEIKQIKKQNSDIVENNENSRYNDTKFEFFNFYFMITLKN